MRISVTSLNESSFRLKYLYLSMFDDKNCYIQLVVIDKNCDIVVIEKNCYI